MKAPAPIESYRTGRRLIFPEWLNRRAHSERAFLFFATFQIPAQPDRGRAYSEHGVPISLAPRAHAIRAVRDDKACLRGNARARRLPGSQTASPYLVMGCRPDGPGGPRRTN